MYVLWMTFRQPEQKLFAGESSEKLFVTWVFQPIIKTNESTATVRIPRVFDWQTNYHLKKEKNNDNFLIKNYFAPCKVVKLSHRRQYIIDEYNMPPKLIDGFYCSIKMDSVSVNKKGAQLTSV